MNILHICPTHLSDVATSPWEIQVIFSILLLVYFRLFTLPQKKTNSNCCTAALAVNLLLFSASYYLHSPSTVDVFWNSVVSISLAQTKTIFCEHIIDYNTA